MLIQPKDYIYTKEGLFFAVVSDLIENNRALSFLRYRDNNGVLEKLETNVATDFVNEHYAAYNFHSQYADIGLHGIPLEQILKLYRPQETVTKLLASGKLDTKQHDALKMIGFLIDENIDKECLGITGSIMLEAHNEKSDIDMVIYGRENFHRVRGLLKKMTSNDGPASIDESMWRDTYQRRDCELDFNEYYMHELKKYNKCMSGSSKVDFSMLPLASEKVEECGPYKKLGKEKIVARVVDANFTFDFPARYYIDHKYINEVVVYTATYIGQAEINDRIEAVGYIEEDRYGKKRLVVGTSREAKGEYIKNLTP